MVTTNQPPAQPSEPQPPTDAEIDRAMAWIDGVNGSAGHHLDDPHLRDLLRKTIAGEITGEEYDRLGMAHINASAAARAETSDERAYIPVTQVIKNLVNPDIYDRD
jgi:hypothetical protein